MLRFPVVLLEYVLLLQSPLHIGCAASLLVRHLRHRYQNVHHELLCFHGCQVQVGPKALPIIEHSLGLLLPKAIGMSTCLMLAFL